MDGSGSTSAPTLIHIPLPGAPLEGLGRLPSRARQSVAAAGLTLPKALASATRTPAALDWVATHSTPGQAWKRLVVEVADQAAFISAAAFALADAESAARIVRELRPDAVVIVMPSLPVQLYVSWQEDVLAGGRESWAARLAEDLTLRPDPATVVKTWRAAFPATRVLIGDARASDPAQLWSVVLPRIPALAALDEASGEIAASAPIGYAEVSLVRRLNAALHARRVRTAEWRALVGAGLVPRLREAAVSVDCEVLLTSEALEELRRTAARVLAELPPDRSAGIDALVPEALPSLLDEPDTVDRDVAIAAAYGLIEARLAMGTPHNTVSQIGIRSLLSELRTRLTGARR